MAQTPQLPSFDNVTGKASDDKKQDLIVFMYNFDNMIGADAGYKQQFKSGGITLHFNLLQQQLGSSRFSFSEGIGISSRNYFNNITNWSNADSIKSMSYGGDTLFVKNKLNITTIEVPLEFRYTSKPNSKNKSFKIAVGGTIGYVIGAKIKREYENGVIEQFRKTDDLRLMNDLRFGFHARIGYHRLGLHVNYGLNNWFNNNGKTGAPFSIGISVLMF